MLKCFGFSVETFSEKKKFFNSDSRHVLRVRQSRFGVKHNWAERNLITMRSRQAARTRRSTSVVPLLLTLISLARIVTAVTCPTSKSECESICSGYNGYSWSSSGSYSSCKCITSNLSQVSPTCTAPSPPPPKSPPPPSPPPTSPPPASQTPVSPSSGDCSCTCCAGYSCSESLAGYFNAGSSSSCTNDACRTRFPSQCPASGSNGVVSSSYTSTSSGPTSPQVGAPNASRGDQTATMFISVLTLLVATALMM